MSADVLGDWRVRYASTVDAWQAVVAADQASEAAAVQQWDARFSHIRAGQEDLVSRGLWRGGPRTLLAALDVQYRELSMTAGLAWLLRPDGHHGLGPGVLLPLLARLGLGGITVGPSVRVVREELRNDTRADLVVYGADWTVVVEAKTFAVEQGQQLDRLYRHWQEEPAPSFVFLTRGSREPTSCEKSRDHWQRLTWREVAAIVETAIGRATDVAPGVYDYVETLEAYHHV